MAHTAFYNRNTGNVWVVPSDRDLDTVFLPKASDREAALAVIAGHGYVRTGDWTPAYEGVASVTLR